MTSLRPGDVLAGFRIEEVAGRGGMGVVHRATQLGLDRPVALKVIADAFAADEGFRERFVAESRAAASIDHPNVIPIYSAGEESEVLYLAMRYVEGADLRTLVRTEGPLEPARAAHVVAQVGAALDAAHASGIVHRDVKPANVLLGAGDHAYLTDFGLTKRVGSHTASGEGGWVGTLGYVAPEQIRNERVDARTDVYALGCVLFHALTGRPPYAGDSDEAVLFAHLEAPPPAPSAHGAPAAFDAVVARALAKGSAERFPSAGDLGRAALAAAGRGRLVPERTVARGAAAPADVAAPTVVSAAAAEAQTTPAAAGATTARRRRRRRAWALAAVPVAALAVVTALAVGGDDAPRSSPTSTASPPPETAPAAPGPPLLADRAFDVNGRPNDVLFADGRLWVLRGGRSRVALVRGRSLRAGPAIGPEPTALAATPGRVWITNAKPATVTAVDVGTARVVAPPVPLGVPGYAVDVAAGEGAVWVGVRGRPGYLVKVDPSQARIVKTIAVREGVQNIAVGLGAVWVTARRGNVVVRVDVRDGSRARIDVGDEPRGVATGGGAAWIANGGDDTVTRVDARTGTTEEIPVGRQPHGVAYGEGAVFVSNRVGDSVTRIDARGREAVGTVRTGRNPFALDVGGGGLYVASPPDRTVYRLWFGR